MIPSTWIEISSKRLLQNLTTCRQMLSDKTKVLAVVKANAYGHDLKEVVNTISSQVDWFGVSSPEEGKIIRATGFSLPILILRNLFGQEIEKAIVGDLSFAVFDKKTLDQVVKAATKLKKVARLHLKVETGTNRLGANKEDLLSLIKAAENEKYICFEGVYTHFANIEEKKGDGFSREQIKIFGEAVSLLEKELGQPLIKHTACTAAIFDYPQTHFDLVRLGIGLYGLSSKTEPVLTWKTKLLQVKGVLTGETVGYGRSFTAEREMRIGIIPVGYYDGYDRHLSNIGRVLVKGRYAPVVGRICMNMTMIDLTGFDSVDQGEEVVLIGKNGDNEITAEEIARQIGTINYEVVSRINPRLPRVVV